MRNFKLTIEYDGTNYAGWQVQKSCASHVARRTSKTIQGTLEKTLFQILQEKIRLIASGRTDAGVHALAQAANFKTESKIALEKLQRALNGLLPEDIKISKIEEKDLDFHSRFCVKSKVYRYTILNRSYRSALLRDKVYFYPYPLNVRLMQKEARVLLGKHDFSAFQASGSSQQSSVRTIKKIKINQNKDLVYVEIEADGFLYNMVRNIVGTLIEIGRARYQPGHILKLLKEKNRALCGPCAPAKGLYLCDVRY